MSDRDNDELARALAGLASGDHADETEVSGHDDSVEHADPAPASPARAETPARRVTENREPAPSKPSAPRAAGPARPAGPVPARPAAPAGSAPPRPSRAAAPASASGSTPGASSGSTPAPARPGAPGATRPAAPGSASPPRPQRPAAPGTARPPTPVSASRPARAAAPVVPAEAAPAPAAKAEPEPVDVEAQHAQQAEAMSHVVEDDDSVIVPAAPVEYLGHAPPKAARRHLPGSRGKSLKFRRTIVPVLLTFGFMLLVAGSLKFFVGEESPLVEFPLWMSLAAWGAALPLFAVAVLNMLFIRQELATAAAEAAILAKG